MARFIIPTHEPPEGVQPLLFHSTIGPVLFVLGDEETAQIIGQSAVMQAHPGTSFLNLIRAKGPDALIDQLDGVPVGEANPDAEMIVAIEGEELFDALYAEFLEEASIADARTVAQEISPSSAVLYNTANRLRERGEFDEAIAAYGRVIVREPGFALAYVNRGLTSIKMGATSPGVDDLYQAATIGVTTEDWFAEVLADQILAGRGFLGLREASQDSAISASLRLELEEIFERYLNGATAPGDDELIGAGRQLVRERPELGIEFDPGAMRNRCLIADVFRARFDIGNELDLLHELYSASPNESEPELAWRIAYAQGAIPYSIVSADLAMSYEAHTLVFDDAAFGDQFIIDDIEALDRVIADVGGIAVPDGSARDRLMHAALDRFGVAADLLLRARIEAPAPPGTSAAHWQLCTNLLTSYALIAKELGHFDGLSSAIEAMRHLSLLLGMTRNELDAETLVISSALGETADPHVTAETLLPIMEASRRGAVLSLFTYETGFENIGLLSVVDGHREAVTTSITPAELIPILKAGVGWIDERQRADLPWKLQLLLRDAGVPQFDYPGVLSEAILPTVRDAMDDLERLVFIPYGYLHNLPLHLLGEIREAVFAAPDLEVIYAPSPFAPARRAAARSEAPHHTRAMLIATSDTNYALELQALRATADEFDLLVDPSVAQVQRVLPQYDIVHFACHGGFDPQRRSSYLLLGSERLYAKHLLEVGDTLPWLVFMNACVSGNALLEGRSGDQTIGLHTALLRAGVSNVIGALWSITEAEAGQYSEHLYRLVLSERRPIRRAWIDAQRTLRDAVDRDNLYLWGGHALYSTIP